MDRTRPKPSLGVIFHPKFPPETLGGYARKAEAAGFDELWLWDDCFLPGALTSAAIALSATRKLKVGIGLIPVPVYNPLFAAMEITTLACAFPGRILPGFGHGVKEWMKQIGPVPKSSLKAIDETVTSIRRLMKGEMVSLDGDWVHLDQVQMQMKPETVPPFYIGGMREKTLRLAGRVAEGTILTGMSSPEYIRWASEHIQSGMKAAGENEHRIAVYLDVKVNPDGRIARDATRRSLAERLPWDSAQIDALGITSEVTAFLKKYTSTEEIARDLPDEWLDAFAAAGTPDQVVEGIRRRVEAGADAIIFQPLWGDADCLDEYIRWLAPVHNILA